MIYYKITIRTICDHPCVEHIKTKQLTMFGKYGEIWQVDQYELRAIIYSPQLAKRYLSQQSVASSESDGAVFTRLKIIELPELIKFLMVPKKSKSQLVLAFKHKAHFIDGDINHD